MKNIYKISLLFTLCGFIFTSCEQNIDDTIAPTVEKVSANVSLTKITTDEFILEAGGVVDFNITLSNALPFNAIASLDIVSSDGSLVTTSGLEEIIYNSEITIAAGVTSTTFSLTFVDDTISDIETYTVTLSNFRPSDGNFPDLAEITASTPLTETIEVYDVLPVIIKTTTADVEINFTWAGTNDLDCRLRTAALGSVDAGYAYSTNGTIGETMDFLGSEPDGDYVISIRPWTVNDSSIAFSFDFVHETGNKVFSSTLENATGGWNQEDLFLEINKVTDGAEVTYTFTQIF